VDGEAMQQVIPRLQSVHVDILCISHRAAVAEASAGLILPDGIPQEVCRIVGILPLQMPALHLAVARGNNPDTPRELSKITETL
jgi:glutamine---fructose-6-phosphate transaminase (isomerizing)